MWGGGGLARTRQRTVARSDVAVHWAAEAVAMTPRQCRHRPTTLQATPYLNSEHEHSVSTKSWIFIWEQMERRSMTYFYHRCKNFFYVFLFWSRFYVFNVFLFSRRFFIWKNVGKVQSGKQINKKHFQNDSNETELWFMCRIELQALAGIWNSMGS